MVEQELPCRNCILEKVSQTSYHLVVALVGRCRGSSFPIDSEID